MAATTTSTSPVSLLLHLLLLLSTQSPYSSASPTPHRTLLGSGRSSRPQISSCNDLSSKSQCVPNPKCRWCTSEALDDMCFGKYEAWRLPQEVFLCN